MKPLSRFCPVGVEFVFQGFLAKDAAIGAKDFCVGFKEAAFAGALGAVDDDGAVHFCARVLYGVGEPAEHPVVYVSGVWFVAA